MSNTSAKKSELIEFRISHAAKTEFLERCKAEKRSASEVIRALMRDHVARHLQREQPRNRWRSMMTDLASKKPLSLGAMVAAASLGGLSIATSASADPAQAFGSIDADNNGWISEQEFLTAVEPTTVITMHRNGEQARFISRNEARRLLRKEYRAYDENRDGRVDAREFSPRYDVTSRVSFYLLDQNRDGELKLDELLDYTAGSRDEAERLALVFTMLDINQNGAITLKEYQIISS